MVRLSVNVNKAATLRNARGGNVPDVLRVARTCIEAGCHGITVHPRPDGRHIRPADVEALAAMLTVEFNVEGYPSPAFLDLVCRVRPTQCTLVPDAPDVLTSNAGWRLGDDTAWLAGVIERLHGAGCRVSLFMDPEPAAMERARALGADRVELYTEPYARAFHTPERDAVLVRYQEAAEAALAAGLGVNAGHDLDLENLPLLARRLPGLLEVSIGHALISDALFMGLAAAVRAYLAALGSEG
ncbi:MAG TPA: pyridoxine 5'-phosphate synthase [Candidatus Limnocylindria bacterium]|nr:pyridoxine 5'-phosphate synthase [Candidatus Limnocylindria bacterium]